MIVPAFGCIFFLIAACFVSVVYPAETSSNTETWPWPYRTRAPEIPLNATDVESKESNTKPDRSRNGQNARKFPSISPIIRVRVFEPNSSRTAIHSPVKIHVVSAEDSTKLRKRSHGPILLPDDNFISRSSSVMEYDGYPVLQKQPKSKSIEPKILEIPNELQGTDSLRNSGSSRTIWPNKDRPRDRKDKERKKNKGKKRKKDRKNKLKVRAIMYEEMKGFPTRKVPPIGTTFVSLHSPRRLHIPVWGKGKRNGSVPVDTSSESSKHKQCFQCPTNITYTADKKKSSLTLPVPSVAICRKHAMRRGRLNLAVLSGPSPGTILSEGEYPTHLIGWKAGGPLYSCHYKVTVEVKRCPDLSSKEGLEVECEDGNVWGSSCKFSCVSSGKALTGANNAVCVESENGVMEWSSPLPVCGNKREPEIVATPRHRKPCKAPPEPSHGAIVCNTQLEDGFYQSNTICQFFCFPGYELQPDSEDSLVVCKKGSWTPKADITCKAVHCPRLKSPENGKIKCKSPVKDPSGNGGAPKGTTCAFNCNPGFVIPSSMEHLKYVECLAPEWNQTSVPECKQKVTPKPGPGECKDKTYYITQNNEVRLSNPLFFVEHDNGTKIQIRNVSCTHKSGKLIVGKHANKCTAYDSELDSIGSCTYTIEVKEKSCKAPRNIQKSKLNCTYRKRPISNGNYLPGTVCEISCETGYAFSQQLGSKVFSRCLPNLRWNRSWKLSCRKVSASCPALDSIPNGNVTCRAKANGNTHSVSSLCSYVCDDGFVVPTSHLALVSRRCKPNGQWNETKAPSCIRAIPPQPDNTTCSSTGLSVDGNPLLPFPNTTFPSPEFVTADGNRITSNCTESSADSNGLINVTCTAYDSEVRSWGSCSFNINSTAEVFEPAVSGEPVTIVADCQAVILAPGNVSELVLPDFTSLLNDTVQTNCTAVNLTEIGVQNVSCVGLDPKTNNSASCSFHVTIIDDADSDSTTVSHSSTVESSTSPSTTETATEPSDSSDTASESSVDDTSFTEPSTTTTDVTTTEVTNGTDDAPVAVEPGCVDQITESGFNFNVSYPEFITSRNTPAEVVCSPVDPDIHETQTVSCEAIDHETNASSSCEFKVTVADGNLRSHDVMEDITEALTREIITSLSQGLLDCPPLEAPTNGFINCSSPDECVVECNEGYKFSSDHPILLEGKLSCDKSTGFWNFDSDDDRIPDCLRELPTTSVEVWLGFNANVDNCTYDEESVETKIKQKLLELNNETCQLINCNASLLLNCSEEDEETNTTVVVTWNLRASYDPKDYKFNNKVPLAETQLESVLDKTKDAVLSDDEFSEDLNSVGLALVRNSFRRGRMVLVCDERGFVVESETDRCVECAAGTIEVGGSCVKCPPQHFQDKNGQTECMPCPTNAPSEDKPPAGC